MSKEDQELEKHDETEKLVEQQGGITDVEEVLPIVDVFQREKPPLLKDGSFNLSDTYKPSKKLSKPSDSLNLFTKKLNKLFQTKQFDVLHQRLDDAKEIAKINSFLMFIFYTIILTIKSRLFILSLSLLFLRVGNISLTIVIVYLVLDFLFYIGYYNDFFFYLIRFAKYCCGNKRTYVKPYHSILHFILAVEHTKEDKLVSIIRISWSLMLFICIFGVGLVISYFDENPFLPLFHCWISNNQTQDFVITDMFGLSSNGNITRTQGPCAFYDFSFIEYYKGVIIGLIQLIGLITQIYYYDGPVCSRHLWQMKKMKEHKLLRTFPHVDPDFWDLVLKSTEDICNDFTSDLNYLAASRKSKFSSSLDSETDHAYSKSKRKIKSRFIRSYLSYIEREVDENVSHLDITYFDHINPYELGYLVAFFVSLGKNCKNLTLFNKKTKNVRKIEKTWRRGYKEKCPKCGGCCGSMLFCFGYVSRILVCFHMFCLWVVNFKIVMYFCYLLMLGFVAIGAPGFVILFVFLFVKGNVEYFLANQQAEVLAQIGVYSLVGFIAIVLSLFAGVFLFINIAKIIHYYYKRYFVYKRGKQKKLIEMVDLLHKDAELIEMQKLQKQTKVIKDDVIIEDGKLEIKIEKGVDMPKIEGFAEMLKTDYIQEVYEFFNEKISKINVMIKFFQKNKKIDERLLDEVDNHRFKLGKKVCKLLFTAIREESEFNLLILKYDVFNREKLRTSLCDMYHISFDDLDFYIEKILLISIDEISNTFLLLNILTVEDHDALSQVKKKIKEKLDVKKKFFDMITKKHKLIY